ncbi:MAG: NADPH:quinone oxidoreductase [Gammaproteobacteria bacterium RIFCSPLOWO2_02_FULL_56_15]|nr:MAG: NADPH:quinone oxidoreductase [Gammaproteobacteria bacterium RIFCSPLOWO2_02_FULL_56_15]
MKAWIIRKGSTSLDGLQPIERPDPAPAGREILVRMQAASINYRDQVIATGRYFNQEVAVDTVPLSDGAGEVVAAGPEVRRFRTGDRILGTFFRDWIDGPPPAVGRVTALGQSGVDGVLAEHVVFHEDNAVRIPGYLSFEEAACLPCAALTAWNSLVTQGRIRQGQSVLTLGTGGVSIAALQFAKANGARVIITSSSDAKLEKARGLGADELINYVRTPEWDRAVLEVTGGKGVDHIIEVGGLGTLARSFQAIGVGGKIALIGFLAGQEGEYATRNLMGKWARLQGIMVGNRTMLEEMLGAMEVNAIRPVIDRVFDFNEAPEAYRHEFAGRHFGKVVIAI